MSTEPSHHPSRVLPFSSKHRLDVLSDGIYAIALTFLVLELKVRPAHLLASPERHVAELRPAVARSLRLRVWTLTACAAAAFLRAFVAPVLNTLAMLPTALLPRIARLSKYPLQED